MGIFNKISGQHTVDEVHRFHAKMEEVHTALATRMMEILDKEARMREQQRALEKAQQELRELLQKYETKFAAQAARTERLVIDSDAAAVQGDLERFLNSAEQRIRVALQVPESIRMWTRIRFSLALCIVLSVVAIIVSFAF